MRIRDPRPGLVYRFPRGGGRVRRALPQATGRPRATILGGLGAIRDSASAEAFRKALGDADRDTRLVAAKALAELGDTAASAPLLQAATGADSIMQKGLMGAACLRLAQRLVEQGKPADAERFLLQLWKAPPIPPTSTCGAALCTNWAAPVARRRARSWRRSLVATTPVWPGPPCAGWPARQVAS